MILKNLDNETRKCMLLEIETDEQSNKVYFSPRLNESGRDAYLSLLKEAARHGDVATFMLKLNLNYFNSHYQRKAIKGGFVLVKMPWDAPQTLAEGEFNRYYIRGLCRRSIETGEGKVKIYRAKVVINPRFDSEQKIGKVYDAKLLLKDLRNNIGIDTAFGLPNGPNSGLSVELA